MEQWLTDFRHEQQQQQQRQQQRQDVNQELPPVNDLKTEKQVGLVDRVENVQNHHEFVSRIR